MGYFSSGSEGADYEWQYCRNCAHYRSPEQGRACPVWEAHLMYCSQAASQEHASSELGTTEYIIQIGDGEPVSVTEGNTTMVTTQRWKVDLTALAAVLDILIPPQDYTCPKTGRVAKGIHNGQCAMFMPKDADSHGI